MKRVCYYVKEEGINIGTNISFASGPDLTGGSLSLPESAGPSPAILLLPAIAGLNSYISRTADELAAQGFVCLALDYYAREGGAPDLSDRAKIMAAYSSLSDSRTLGDIRAAVAYLKAQPFVDTDRLAVLGFCIGGTYSILSGVNVSAFKCAISFYGSLKYGEITEAKPVSPLDVVQKLSCPLLGHYGEADPLIPLEHVLELRNKLQNYPAEIYTYPGAGHAFHEDFRKEVYRPAAAQEAWQRTLTYLRWYCRTE